MIMMKKVSIFLGCACFLSLFILQPAYAQWSGFSYPYGFGAYNSYNYGYPYSGFSQPNYGYSWNQPYSYDLGQTSYGYGWNQPSYGWDAYNYMYPFNYNPYSYTWNQPSYGYGWNGYNYPYSYNPYSSNPYGSNPYGYGYLYVPTSKGNVYRISPGGSIRLIYPDGGGVEMGPHLL